MNLKHFFWSHIQNACHDKRRERQKNPPTWKSIKKKLREMDKGEIHFSLSFCEPSSFPNTTLKAPEGRRLFSHPSWCALASYIRATRGHPKARPRWELPDGRHSFSFQMYYGNPTEAFFLWHSTVTGPCRRDTVDTTRWAIRCKESNDPCGRLCNNQGNFNKTCLCHLSLYLVCMCMSSFPQFVMRTKFILNAKLTLSRCKIKID